MRVRGWMSWMLLIGIAGCGKDDPTGVNLLTNYVTGTVSDSAGTAVAGAEVSLSLQSPNGIGMTTFTTTAANGSFAFNNLTSGNYTLWARSANGARVAGTATAIPRPTTPITMTLRRPCAARGVVVGGDPQDAVVSVETAFGIPDSTGAYLVAGVPIGTWTCTISRPLARTTKDTVITFAAPGDTLNVPPIRLP